MSQGYTFDEPTVKRIFAAVKRVEGVRPTTASTAIQPGVTPGTLVRIAQVQNGAFGAGVTINANDNSNPTTVEFFFLNSSGVPTDAGDQPSAVTNRGLASISQGTYIYLADLSGNGTNWDVLSTPPSPLVLATMTAPLLGISAAVGRGGPTGSPASGSASNQNLQIYNPVGLVVSGALSESVWVQTYGDGSADAISGGNPTRDASFTGTITPGGSGSATVTGFGTQTVTDPGNIGALAGSKGIVTFKNNGAAGAWIIVSSGCPSS